MTNIPFIQKHQCICAWFERCGEQPRISLEYFKKFKKNPEKFIDHTFPQIDRPLIPDMPCSCSLGKFCDQNTFKNFKNPKGQAKMKEILARLNDRNRNDVEVGMNPNKTV